MLEFQKPREVEQEEQHHFPPAANPDHVFTEKDGEKLAKVTENRMAGATLCRETIKRLPSTAQERMWCFLEGCCRFFPQMCQVSARRDS